MNEFGQPMRSSLYLHGVGCGYDVGFDPLHKLLLVLLNAVCQTLT